MILYVTNYDQQTLSFFWGNIWALISLVCWTGLLINTNELLTLLPPAFIVCVQAYLTLIFTFFAYLIQNGFTGLFSTDPLNGVLGFLSSNYFFISIILIGPIC